MGTKQIKIQFLVEADDGVSAGVTITVGGVQKWSGDLAQTNNSIPGPDWPPDWPYAVAEFDLDIDDYVTNTEQYTTVEDFTFTATRGTVTIIFLSANYTIDNIPSPTPTSPPPWKEPLTWTLVAGNAETFYMPITPSDQPTWNGVPVTSKYNVADNPMGPIPFSTGEVLAYSANVPKYNDHV